TGADTVVEQVVHDPVAEVGGPHLARLGPGDDETDGAPRSILATDQLIKELGQIALQVELESQGAGTVSLGAAAIEICMHQFFE
ncbi:hypothetical protein EY06_15130, partial [Staphylococcus aureus]